MAKGDLDNARPATAIEIPTEENDWQPCTIDEFLGPKGHGTLRAVCESRDFVLGQVTWQRQQTDDFVLGLLSRVAYGTEARNEFGELQESQPSADAIRSYELLPFGQTVARWNIVAEILFPFFLEQFHQRLERFSKELTRLEPVDLFLAAREPRIAIQISNHFVLLSDQKIIRERIARSRPGKAVESAEELRDRWMRRLGTGISADIRQTQNEAILLPIALNLAGIAKAQGQAPPSFGALLSNPDIGPKVSRIGHYCTVLRWLTWLENAEQGQVLDAETRDELVPALMALKDAECAPQMLALVVAYGLAARLPLEQMGSKNKATHTSLERLIDLLPLAQAVYHPAAGQEVTIVPRFYLNAMREFLQEHIRNIDRSTGSSHLAEVLARHNRQASFEVVSKRIHPVGNDQLLQEFDILSRSGKRVSLDDYFGRAIKPAQSKRAKLR